jgi:hypothetical protein
MENRAEVVAEYFELRVLLNKANLKKNETTEVDFQIIKNQGIYYLVAFLKGAAKPAHLNLCYLDRVRWAESNVTRFTFLEEFCRNFLNANFRSTPGIDHKELCSNLKKELQGLGIPN